MAGEPSSSAPRMLSSLFHSGTLTGLGDHELLERFAAQRDGNQESAELVFATLVERHGPMVMRVCRAVLGDRHEAEDAFQATFLVLASRAGAIQPGSSVASWLYGVALRVSANARSKASRRRRHERRLANMARRDITAADIESSTIGDERDRVVHQEIGRLPERFRSAVVLCYLEGATHDQAALQLGCPVGTIRSRLANARERLRKRLTRRGLAPVERSDGVSGRSLVAGSESTGPQVPVSAALVEATVRGALHVELGRRTLSGIVSLEAITLMEGVLKTMAITKLMLVTATILVAGFVTTGAGVAAYSALPRDETVAITVAGSLNPPQNPVGVRPAVGTQSPPQERTAPQPPPDAVKKATSRDTEDRVKALIQSFQTDREAFGKEVRNAKTPEARKALQQTHPGSNPAFYAGALLQLAEQDPESPAALDALLWIVAHLTYGSMPERAKEMITRDHIQSDRIEPLFTQVQALMRGSRATERLFREALAKSPSKKIQGLACFYLARFLDTQASAVRLAKTFTPEQLAKERVPIMAEGWGYDYEERLLKMDPEALERETASLYKRVAQEFGDLPVVHPADRMLPERPATLGAAALIYLRELESLGIGRLGPEIEGIDLEGRPMKLSDYRGRVVALYLCGPAQLNDRAPVTKNVSAVALRHEGDRFALLGVATASSDRDFARKAVTASGLPARFWFDPDRDGKPGPIQTAWNAQIDLYVLDHRGVIRYKHVFRPELFETAVATLLKEQHEELERPKK
jgi:RNA polymerase sigma factor (sigma-70 family)